MPILNYTTSIDPARSVSEIQRILARHGATRVMVEYDAATGAPSGLTFAIQAGGFPAAFRLPARVDGVLAALSRSRGKGGVTRSHCTRIHACRVAWRILKDWVESQLALVEAGLTTVDEVMLPYMLVRGERTVYQDVIDQRQLAGPKGGE